MSADYATIRVAPATAARLRALQAHLRRAPVLDAAELPEAGAALAAGYPLSGVVALALALLEVRLPTEEQAPSPAGEVRPRQKAARP